MEWTTVAPGLALLRGYRREWLPADIGAGLSVAAVALPTAIAYAQLAGFPPVVGLYAAILPLVVYAAFGTSRQDYLAAFRSSLEAMADKVRPELIILSAGFDAHAEDPVGSLGLEVEDFETMTREVLQVAEVHAKGRLVSVMEGGYNVSILAGCVAAHLQALGAVVD